jgi:hypothetical protein
MAQQQINRYYQAHAYFLISSATLQCVRSGNATSTNSAPPAAVLLPLGIYRCNRRDGLCRDAWRSRSARPRGHGGSHRHSWPARTYRLLRNSGGAGNRRTHGDSGPRRSARVDRAGWSHRSAWKCRCRGCNGRHW